MSTVDAQLVISPRIISATQKPPLFNTQNTHPMILTKEDGTIIIYHLTVKNLAFCVYFNDFLKALGTVLVSLLK